MMRLGGKKSPGRLLNLHPSAVFTGLRPSRKPRWAPLLPHHPLRPPLSRQGPRSRRRRSWAPTMRSRRTPQTTAKVRQTHTQTYTHTYTLKSSVYADYFYSLHLSHRAQQWLPCLLSLLFFPSFLPPSCCCSHQFDTRATCDSSVSRLFGCCQRGAAV